MSFQCSFFWSMPRATSNCISNLQTRDINEKMCKPQIDMKEKLCTRKKKKEPHRTHETYVMRLV